MAEPKQITELPASSTADDTALTYIRENGVDKSATLGLVRSPMLKISNALSELTANASSARANLGLSPVATMTAGNGPNQLVQLNSSAMLPSVDASQLYNVPASPNSLLKSNNLSDLTDPATARANLGISDTATLTPGDGPGQLVQLDNSGNLPALDGSALTNLPFPADALNKNANLSDVANVATARTNLGLKELATKDASEIVDNVTIAQTAGVLSVKDNGISTAKIQDSAIASAKIADDAVQAKHLNADVITPSMGLVQDATGSLGVKVDNTTVTINANGELVSAASGLDVSTIVDGVTTIASGGKISLKDLAVQDRYLHPNVVTPNMGLVQGVSGSLGVKVDNTTVTINANGELVSAGGGGAGGGLAKVEDDPTPKLGGNLTIGGRYLNINSGYGFSDLSGNGILFFDSVANATNFVKVRNSATGQPLSILAQGGDGDIGFSILPKGFARVRVQNLDMEAHTEQYRTMAVTGTMGISGQFATVTEITVSGNSTITLGAPANTSGKCFTMSIIKNSTAAYTITWTNVKWPGGTPPTLTANGKDVLTFFTVDGGASWIGALALKDVK